MTMAKEQRERIPIPETLHSFISKGRRETYAGNGKPAQTPLIEGTTQFEHRDGDYLYRDIFVSGEDNFAGQETVYRGDKPIWTLTYFGALLWGGLNEFTKGGRRKSFGRVPTEDEIYKFLKKALSEKAEEVRFGEEGKRVFREGDWEYAEKGEEDFAESPDFSGEETIKLAGIPIYRLKYQGGGMRPHITSINTFLDQTPQV